MNKNQEESTNQLIEDIENMISQSMTLRDYYESIEDYNRRGCKTAEIDNMESILKKIREIKSLSDTNKSDVIDSIKSNEVEVCNWCEGKGYITPDNGFEESCTKCQKQQT